MKRLFCIFLALIFCFLSFSACAQKKYEVQTLSCRVIAVIGNELLLASEGYEPILTLSPNDNPNISVLRDGIPAAEGDCPIPGDRILLTFEGGMLDTLPSVPRGVTQMEIVSSEFDNLAAVYLDVLTDLAKEEGNNVASHAMLAVSLEETALPAWEQTAVVYAIAKQYPDVSVIEESRADLMAKGFMTKTKDGHRWYWNGGTLLAIYEYPKKCTDKKRYFNADLGHSYVWTNCRTSRDADSGIWSPYEKGGIMHVD